MARFDYLEPHSIDEALQMIADGGEGARLAAGSTDFLIRWRTGVWRPQVVVCMQHVPGLDNISWNPDDGLSMGSMVTVQTIEQHGDVRNHYPALAAGAAAFAGVQVRNLATIGGNVCNASPAGDTLPALLAYDTQCRIVGPQGERWLPLSEVFIGPGRTALVAGEILTELRLPPPLPRSGGLYIKHSPRGAMDISSVGAASVVSMADDGSCVVARIALGAVAPVPMRATAAEGVLAGQTPNTDVIAAAAQAAAEMSTPISDVRNGADYRREMVRVLTQRTLQHAVATAEHGSPTFSELRRLAVETVF